MTFKHLLPLVTLLVIADNLNSESRFYEIKRIPLGQV